jgi:glycosyltransferase involved in cell wall biosynthesis
MIEALACGTPVIAYRCGSVPEVLDHGVTGFIVDNRSEAAKAVGEIGKFDRRRIRETFEKRFTSERMAQSYLDYYEATVRGRAHRRDAAVSAEDALLQERIAITDPRGRRLLPRVN